MAGTVEYSAEQLSLLNLLRNRWVRRAAFREVKIREFLYSSYNYALREWVGYNSCSSL